MAENRSDNVRTLDITLMLSGAWVTDSKFRVTTSEVNGESKPTLLVGAKRRQKSETFPSLIMTAHISEILAANSLNNNIDVTQL